MKEAILTAALAALVLSGCAEFGAYPGVEMSRGTQSRVVIDARVNAFGELEDVRITGEGADAEEFVGAVRDALPLFRLDPPLGTDCRPTKQGILRFPPAQPGTAGSRHNCNDVVFAAR
ncbi:MAG TPA: hypothetical protein VKR38_01475 [Usitatibacter sp.]|nr:hypothetical protein [Usitatibacter sp.]